EYSPTGYFTTNSVGLVSEGDVLSFDYKLVNYYGDGHPGADSGYYIIEVSTDFGETYELLETIVYNDIVGWQNETFSLDEYDGEYVKIKITDTWTGSASTDFYIGFDNFYIGVPP